MNFTMRKNGELMATVHVKHHIGREALIDAAIRLYAEGVESPTKSLIIKRLRDNLEYHGSFGADAVAELAEDENDEFVKWRETASCAVDKLFPALKGTNR
jgi:hypothetical protein